MSFTEKLRVVIDVVTDKASSAVKGFGKDVDDVDDKVDKTSKRHQSRMGSFRDATIAGFGVEQIVAFAGQILNAGTALEAMEAKSETVFGDQIGRVKSWAAENAAAMGLTESAAVGVGASMADLLKPMGFTTKEATDQAVKMLDLSAALSAWSGGTKTAADVGDILTKAMLGEREQLKTLGISITEADVKARLLANGTAQLTGAALQQAKAIATQQLIFEKSTDAQTAWADGSMDATKKANESKASMAEMGETVTRALLPVLQAIVPAVADVVESLEPLLGALGYLAKIIAVDLNAALGESLVEVGDFAGALAAMAELAARNADAVALATAQAAAFGPAAEDAASKTYELRKRTEEAAEQFNELRAATDEAKGSISELQGTMSVDKSWTDLQLNLLGVQDKLDALAAKFKKGELTPQEYALSVQQAMQGAQGDILGFITKLGDIPESVATDILALFDPADVDASIVAMQAMVDKYHLSVSVDGKFSGNISGMPKGARAAGGPVNSAGAYLVGELGPEIVNLPGGSNVIPNSALGGGSGSTTVQINVSVAPGGDMIAAGRATADALAAYYRSGGAKVG